MQTNLYSMACESFALHLLVRADVLAVLDGLSAVLGVLTIDGVADATASSQNLEDGALELLGVGAATHGASNSVHIVPGNVAIVGDVLHLLAVPRRLLQGFDHQCGGRRHNLDGHLTVLHVKLEVTFMPFHSLVALHRSSPTDLGDSFMGPTLGARA